MATNNKNFEFTDEVKTLLDGTVLHRIRATRDSKWAKKGDLGGWVEKMENLRDSAWVRDSAVVCGSAVVRGSAVVCDSAWVRDSAIVCGSAVVRDSAVVCGSAWVRDSAIVCGSAVVRNSADICTFGTFGSAGRTTTAHRDKEIGVRVNCGCFTGTLDEFCAKVRQTHGESQFAREYLAIAEVIKVKFDHIINPPTDSNNDNDNN